MFRAVHDVFGHAASGRGFDRHGEEAAWLKHSTMYSPLAARALATETRGQTCARIFHYGGRRFPEQKAVLLPRSFSDPRLVSAAAGRGRRGCSPPSCAISRRQFRHGGVIRPVGAYPAARSSALSCRRRPRVLAERGRGRGRRAVGSRTPRGRRRRAAAPGWSASRRHWRAAARNCPADCNRSAYRTPCSGSRPGLPGGGLRSRAGTAAVPARRSRRTPARRRRSSSSHAGDRRQVLAEWGQDA